MVNNFVYLGIVNSEIVIKFGFWKFFNLLRVISEGDSEIHILEVGRSIRPPATSFKNKYESVN